jgi:acyl carrier protein
MRPAAFSRAAIDSRLRPLLADELGIDAAELEPATSLVEDLAADSLDLVALALVVEDRFGFEFPDRAFEETRTYGELVDVVARLATRRSMRTGRWMSRGWVRSRLIPPKSKRWQLLRAAWLTPYDAQLIAEDGRHSAGGTRLDVEVAADGQDGSLTAMRESLARVAEHGVKVAVHLR